MKTSEYNFLLMEEGYGQELEIKPSFKKFVIEYLVFLATVSVMFFIFVDFSNGYWKAEKISVSGEKVKAVSYRGEYTGMKYKTEFLE